MSKVNLISGNLTGILNMNFHIKFNTHITINPFYKFLSNPIL